MAASGIVIVDKPQGWTSQDVTAKLRAVSHQKRIGHGGTLDRMATGALPVFVGRATRAVEFFESAEKGYEAGLCLGRVTNTQDTTGETLEEHPVTVSRADVEAILPQFTGEIDQIPPMYSAVKINGQKLYQLARQGKEIERKPRRITIHSLRLLEGEELRLEVLCSKGTYIRTLCHDIGAALGCGGCMSSLRRTRAGCFTLADSIPLETLIAAEHPEQYLRPVDSLFADLPAVTLTEEQVKPCRNGAAITMEGRGRCRVYGPDREFLMVGRFRKGKLWTEKSFFEV